VEDTANGPAVIETLKGKVPLIAVQTKGMSKLQRAADTSRATSTLAQVEAGQVWLPHPACAPWVEAFVEECALFPNGKHDDMVDMLVHGIRRLTNAVLPGAFAI
jgi:predicted phage terminase large subunit-like protein